MNEPIKKQPVDELFARKLANLSLPADERGFARLQARMNQQMQPEKVVFWRTPTFQRSVAAAACLVLAVTVGWYAQSTSSDKSVLDTGHTIASRTAPVHSGNLGKPENSEKIAKLDISRERAKKPAQIADKSITKVAVDVNPAVELAVLTKPKSNKTQLKSAKRTNTLVNDITETKTNEEQLASVTPASARENVNAAPSDTKPRTLVVTVAEPDVLVAARQTAQEADQKVVAVNTNTNETGAGKLWRKIQRIRTGEASVAEVTSDNDEKGLLDRAYGELKHSFQKNKPAKQ